LFRGARCNVLQLKCAAVAVLVCCRGRKTHCLDVRVAVLAYCSVSVLQLQCVCFADGARSTCYEVRVAVCCSVSVLQCHCVAVSVCCSVTLTCCEVHVAVCCSVLQRQCVVA